MSEYDTNGLLNVELMYKSCSDLQHMLIWSEASKQIQLNVQLSVMLNSISVVSYRYKQLISLQNMQLRY